MQPAPGHLLLPREAPEPPAPAIASAAQTLPRPPCSGKLDPVSGLVRIRLARLAAGTAATRPPPVLAAALARPQPPGWTAWSAVGPRPPQPVSCDRIQRRTPSCLSPGPLRAKEQRLKAYVRRLWRV